MKFTITPEPLIRMLVMAGEWRSNRKRGGVRLLASEGRVCVESGGKAAEAAALVWEDGQCRLSRSQFLQALKRHRAAAELTIQADAHGLHLDGVCLPVSSFSPQATLPTECQVFLTTELEVVSPEKVGALGA